jgi:hypothetical protein
MTRNLSLRSKQALLAAFVLGSAATQAQMLSATCAEPTGSRLDFVNGQIRQDKDGFSGVQPQFVLSLSSPDRITVIWPDSKSFGASARQNAYEAQVISRSDSMIMAVAQYKTRTDMFTLFPQSGLIFMSTHRMLQVNPGVPNASQYYMKCKFESQ